MSVREASPKYVCHAQLDRNAKPGTPTLRPGKHRFAKVDANDARLRRIEW